MDTPTPEHSFDALQFVEIFTHEFPIGSAQLVELPGNDGNALDNWRLAHTHLGSKPNERGAPVRTCTAIFMRPVASKPARAAIAPPQTNVRMPNNARRMQPAGAGVVPVVARAAAAVQKTVAAVEQAATTAVDNAIEAALACKCSEPQPAVDGDGSKAVPCLGCGGWIAPRAAEAAAQ